MGKHFDEDGDGIADGGWPPAVRPDDSDFDLGVAHVPGQYFHRLDVFPGGGRHVLHDNRSKAYDAATLVEHVTARRTTYHQRMVPVWGQGDVGACTAFAALGLMGTEPFYRPSWRLAPDRALQFYELETQLDDAQIPGHYPPDDTGSTGLWSMKALKRLGYITGYRHAFSFATVQKLLQVTPVSFGFPWFNSMFEPDRNGLLTVDQASGLAGGHQLVGSGIDFERGLIELTNSWGEHWGRQGKAYLSFAAADLLLRIHGDCSVPSGVGL